MKFTQTLAKLDCSLGHACQFCPDEETCSFDKPYHNKVLIEARLADIGQIIVVLANKGGVGKSTVAANLAAGLGQKGFRVGMADADIHGPNQSRFFGFTGARTRTSYSGLQPMTYQPQGMAHGVKVGSLAFMLEDDTVPVVWRDAYKHDFIHHLIGSFDWGMLDFLIVDMPPGTGNELITLCDMLEGSNLSAVLVSTPQAVAQMDSLKAARFCKERGLPVIGAVENMAGVICPHCAESFHLFPQAGLEAALADMGIKRIAAIPLAAELALGSDRGMPLVCADPDNPVARAFGPVIDAALERARADFGDAAAIGLGEALKDQLEQTDLAGAIEDLPAADRQRIESQLGRLLEEETTRLHDNALRGSAVLNGTNDVP